MGKRDPLPWSRRRRGINLIRAWCPRVNRLSVLPYPRERVPHRGVLIAVVVLAVLWGPMVVVSWEVVNPGISLPRHERVEIVYAAANQASREIVCKLRNMGNTQSTLEEVRVNGSEVSTGDPLPITMGASLDYMFSGTMDRGKAQCS